MNIDEKLIKNLNNLQKNLLKENHPQYIIANESLNIIKGHPSYMNIFEVNKFFKYLFLVVKYLAININYLFGSILYYKTQVLKNNNFDCLVVSHLVFFKKNGFKKYEDFYFEDFDKNKKFKEKNNFRILINHTKEFKRGFSDKKMLVLQNYTNFKYSIKIFCYLYFLFIKYFLYSFIYSDKKSQLLKIIALEFTNPKTFKNLIIKNNFENIIMRKSFKKVFYTHEGFAWERFLCQLIKKNDKTTKIFGYQFAIISKYQNSMFIKIPKIYQPDKILTSGIVNYKILKKHLLNTCILGSSRFMKNNKKLNKFQKTCLVLPEGIDSECKILLKFVLDCISKNFSIKFIIRFHPLTNISKIINRNLKLKLKKNSKNIEISMRSLTHDLSRSSMCLYRGSTSAVTASQSGLIPIYLDLINTLNIDPMFQINKEYRYVQNYKDFLSFLNKSQKNKQKIFKKIQKSSQNYFVKFNNKILENILNG